MATDDWASLWERLVTQWATDPKLQQAVRRADRLMDAYATATPGPGPDIVLRDEAGKILAALEIKTSPRPWSHTPQPGIFTNRLVDILSRAEGNENLVDLAARISSKPDNAEALTKASRSLRNAGVVSKNTGLLLIFVLIWLLAVGIPIALPELPAREQTTVVGELATLPIAIALTGYLRRDK